jgi:predicted ATPase
VVWTPTSVASRWVRGEARVGADRSVLAPVRFDAAQLPIDLRAIQTTDMDDWGGDPQSPQFQALHQSLLAMLGAPAKAGAPCVGRTPELERVREVLGKVKRGEGGFLLFSGEAGVGKSRMILEAERLALDAGFNVLKGACANTESPPPFQPALEQIEQTARRLGPELMRQSMGDNAAEISRLMPELKQRYSDIPEYPTLPPEQERRYLLHGIAEFVARGAARQPLVLIYEDLHWADESTCVLLAYIAERLKNDPVLMIGAYRDSEVGEAPFGRTLQELVRKRLAEDVRHLVESDKLLTEGGKFRDRIEVTDAEVTRGVRFILEDRIGPVGTPCRDVMTIAAVIGRTFAFELLAKTDSARSEDEVLYAVEEAERKHLIEDVSREREARYRFVHEQVRRTLIAGLSLPRRQRLHLRIADALEARFGALADGAQVRRVLAVGERRALRDHL